MRRRNFDDVFDMMRRQFESMFEDFGMGLGQEDNLLPGGRASSVPTGRDKGYRTPLTDTWETENEVVATFEMPGVDKDDIDMNVDDDSLEIKVEKKDENEDKSDDGYSYTSSYAGFYRRIPLPGDVDPEQTKATYNNGVLEVRVPKKEEKKKSRKKIKIE
ncbi:MAG: Hsp20/alpha crystallin family protein [Candidatus Woesearchaeota archaeon]